MTQEKNNLLHRITFVVLGATGGIVLILLINSYGVGLTPDSVAYISVARNILNGRGFIGFDGSHFLLQPPLYPILLVVIKKIFFLDPLISAGYLNACLLGIIVYYSGLIFNKNLKSFLLTIAGTISIMISFVFIQIFLIALSEPLFILLILLYLYYFDVYREKGDITSLLFFSIAVALACLSRYIGVILILTGSISIFIWRIKPFKEMFRHLLIFWFITSLPIGLWIIRNYYQSGTLTGERAASSYTLSENMLFLFNRVLKWFLPVQINGEQLFVFILIISAGIFTGIIFISKYKEKGLLLKKTGPVLLFIFFYVFAILISSSTTAYDKIDNRILSPIFVPLILLMFIIPDRVITSLSRYLYPRLTTILLLVGISFWMNYHLTRTVYNISKFIAQSGEEYGSKAWKENPVIKYLKEHKEFESEYSLYSNVPEAVYILANIETKWSLTKTLYNSPKLINIDPGAERNWYKDNKAVLVWFNNVDRHFLFDLDELKKFNNMGEIVQLKDGQIYTITKK
ncbi:MAG: ArnT family glycosyltransferase [Ignavibacteriaceae bacterium]